MTHATTGILLGRTIVLDVPLAIEDGDTNALGLDAIPRALRALGPIETRAAIPRHERLRDDGEDGGYHQTWMPSLEVQIIEGGVGDFAGVDVHLHAQLRRLALGLDLPRHEGEAEVGYVLFLAALETDDVDPDLDRLGTFRHWRPLQLLECPDRSVYTR